MNVANDSVDNDVIQFAVSGTIRLTSALPNLANNGTLSISNTQSTGVTISGDANESGDAGDVLQFCPLLRR